METLAAPQREIFAVQLETSFMPSAENAARSSMENLSSVDAFLSRYVPRQASIKNFIEGLDAPISCTENNHGTDSSQTKINDQTCQDNSSDLNRAACPTSVSLHKPKCSIRAARTGRETAKAFSIQHFFAAEAGQKSGIFDREERRRAQNREAQRRFREKKLQKMFLGN